MQSHGMDFLSGLPLALQIAIGIVLGVGALGALPFLVGLLALVVACIYEMLMLPAQILQDRRNRDWARGFGREPSETR